MFLCMSVSEKDGKEKPFLVFLVSGVFDKQPPVLYDSLAMICKVLSNLHDPVIP